MSVKSIGSVCIPVYMSVLHTVYMPDCICQPFYAFAYKKGSKSVRGYTTKRTFMFLSRFRNDVLKISSISLHYIVELKVVAFSEKSAR